MPPPDAVWEERGFATDPAEADPGGIGGGGPIERALRPKHRSGRIFSESAYVGALARRAPVQVERSFRRLRPA